MLVGGESFVFSELLLYGSLLYIAEKNPVYYYYSTGAHINLSVSDILNVGPLLVMMFLLVLLLVCFFFTLVNIIL